MTNYEGLVRMFERIAADLENGRYRSLFLPSLRSLTYRRLIVFFARIAAAGDAPAILRIVPPSGDLPALTYFEDVVG